MNQDSNQTACQLKKRSRQLRSVRERIEMKLKAIREGRRPTHTSQVMTPPPYDEVFEQGMQWLDACTQAPADEIKLDLVIHPYR